MNFKQIKFFFIKIINLERITLFITLAFFFFLIGGMYIFNTYQTTKNIRSRIVDFENNALSAVAMSRAKHIETLLNNYKETISMMATGNAFKEIVDESVVYNLKIKQVDKRIETAVSSNNAISRIRVLSKEGIVIASSNSDVGVDKSFHEIFLKGKKGVYMGDIHISDYTKNKVISVAAPILLEEKFAGVIVVNFNVGELYNITTDKTGLKESGEIYVINKDGYAITPSRFDENIFLTQKIDTINSMHCLKGNMPHEEYYGHEAITD